MAETIVNINGLPMVRRQYIGDLQSVWERLNDDPLSPGFARRKGSTRLTNVAQKGQGITRQPELASVGLLDDSFQSLLNTVFTGGTGYTVNFHMRVGAPGMDSTAVRDITLFRWGADSSHNGALEILLRVDPAPSPVVQIVLRVEDSAGVSSEVAYTFPNLPGPDDSVMVSAVATVSSPTLYIDGTSVGAVGRSPSLSAGAWAETTILDRTFRAKAAANNAPLGEFPTITDLAIWDTNLSASQLQSLVGRRLNDTEKQASGLKVYFPLTDDTERIQTDYKTNGRMFLAPAPPHVDSNDGLVFSGIGGYATVGYSPVFDDFFTTVRSAGRGTNWAYQVLVKTPNVLQFPDGYATVALFTHGLLALTIVESGGNYYFKATVGSSGGTTSATSTLALAANTQYLVTISREASAFQLVVSSPSSTVITTASGLDRYGPTLAEGVFPEFYLGILYDPDAGTWSNRFRGSIIRHAFYQNAVPVTSHAPTQLDIVSTEYALFAHDFTVAVGDQAKDIGANGLTAFLEAEDYSGLQVAPPYPGPGPIADGQFQGAAAGAALTGTELVSPQTGSSLTYIRGVLRRPFSTDIQGVRVGNKALLLSNARVSLVDNQAKRLRPFGLPKPTGRPGVFPASAGPLSGVAAYGFTFVSREGTESPLRRLPPAVIRGATMNIGGGDNALGSHYGNTNIAGGAVGRFWRLPDQYTGGGVDYANFPAGVYTGEIEARIDPDLNPDLWREHGMDRWIHNDAAIMLWGAEPTINNGDIGNLNRPWTLQLFSRTELGSSSTEETVVASIGVQDNATGGQDPAASLVITRTNTGRFIVYVANGTTIASGWTRYDTGWTPAVQDVDLFIVHEFVGTTNHIRFYHKGNGTEYTQVADVAFAAGIGGAQEGNAIRLGAAYTIPEPAFSATRTYKKQGANGGDVRWHLCRFWYDRAITPSMMDELAHVFLDPSIASAYSDKLVRDYKFATDDPFARSSTFDCRVSSEVMQFYYTEPSASSTPPEAYDAPQGWDYANRFAPIVEWNANAGLGSSYGTLGNTFTIVWTRIGNGALLVLCGQTLIYYAADDALDPGTPTLPADPQALNWFTWTWESIGGDTANPTFELQSFWVNGVRYFKGGAQTNNHKSSFACALGGTNAYIGDSDDVHIYEVRVWTGTKYDSSDDFEWMSRRIPNDAWSSMVFYGRFHTTVGGGSMDIPNDGTSSDDIEEDGSGTVTLVTVSSVPLPKPPLPDIVAIRIYRSVVLPVQDFSDAREVDRIKRVAEAGPYYFLGSVGRDTEVFQDSIANESLGLPARMTAGYAPRHVTGIATWGGRPVLWGDGLNPLRLYIADPLDFESFEADAYIEVPATEFSEVVAAVEAADSFWVFGYSGGIVFRGADPSRAMPSPIGGGIGAGNPRAIAAGGGIVFVHGVGGLWALTTDRRENIGLPVDDLLPAPANSRLAVVGDDLYVINENTGDSLRFNLSTSTWHRETRNLRSITANLGTTFLVHRSGALAYEAGYGDDLPANQAATEGGVTGGSGTTLVDSSGPFLTAQRGLSGVLVRLIRADGTEEVQEVLSNTSTTLTVAGWSGAPPASGDTWQLGAFETRLDTGWFATPMETHILRHLDVGIDSGSWQVALAGQDEAAIPADTDLSYVALGATGRYSADMAQRYGRAAFRCTKPIQSKLAIASLAVDPSAGKSEMSTNA